MLIEFSSDMASISYNYNIPDGSIYVEDSVILNLIDSLPISDIKVDHVQLSAYFGEEFLRLRLYPNRYELDIFSRDEISVEEAIDLIKNSL